MFFFLPRSQILNLDHIFVSANPSPGHQSVPSNDPENPRLLCVAASDILKTPAVIPEGLKFEPFEADTSPLSEAATDFKEDTNQKNHNQDSCPL